jgi:hypothetical protein
MLDVLPVGSGIIDRRNVICVKGMAQAKQVGTAS